LNVRGISVKVAKMASKEDDKRRRIVDVATNLFSRYGYKRTSIEVLAAEAELAKPTLYAYFDNKDAIFLAVVQAVCDEILTNTAQASRREGSLEERLTAMLAAKFTRYFELVQTSPHAVELIGSHGKIGADIVARTDEVYLGMIVATLDAETNLHPTRVGLKSTHRVAQLLLRAASGAAYDAKTTAEHRRNLGEIVRAVVAGLRG